MTSVLRSSLSTPFELQCSSFFFSFFNDTIVANLGHISCFQNSLGPLLGGDRGPPVAEIFSDHFTFVHASRCRKDHQPTTNRLRSPPRNTLSFIFDEKYQRGGFFSLFSKVIVLPFFFLSLQKQTPTQTITCHWGPIKDAVSFIFDEKYQRGGFFSLFSKVIVLPFFLL